MPTPEGPSGAAPADQPHLRSVPVGADAGPANLEDLVSAVAKGDQTAFAAVYDRVGAQVYGLVRRVLRDPSQSEEVTQEVLLDVWRTASRFDAARGSAVGWIMTMAHRRAVDRVRSEQASRDRNTKVAIRDAGEAEFDVVSEDVEIRLEQEQVRQALSGLTDLQREAIELAYYKGYTYREVAELLDTPLGTVKTRLRDGLIRLRDTIGVVA
jgi:RNA polymerase sigma-70 factor, ECF subfamily